MTVKELIELLSTLPQDSQVVVPHSWDTDMIQLDIVREDDVRVDYATRRSAETLKIVPKAEGMTVVVIG